MQVNNNNSKSSDILRSRNDITSNPSSFVAGGIKNPTLDRTLQLQDMIMAKIIPPSSFVAGDIKTPISDQTLISKNPQALRQDFGFCRPLVLSSPGVVVGPEEAGDFEEDSGREKLFRYWNDVAGKVCIPESWGQEGSLKDWADCSLFDALLVPNGVVSARESLVADRRKRG